jgi:hypothetical protein
VFVPEGTEVDLRGFTLFGHKKLAVRPDPGTRSARRVRVRAYSIFGQVKVWTP